MSVASHISVGLIPPVENGLEDKKLFRDRVYGVCQETKKIEKKK